VSASDAAERVVVTLYTREGCHLCEEAKAAMLPVVAQATAELREIDIDDDPGLRAMYNDSVPVIFVGADFFARYRIDAHKFAKALEAAGRKG
jgi:glutaredoxin